MRRPRLTIRGVTAMVAILALFLAWVLESRKAARLEREFAAYRAQMQRATAKK